MSPLPEAVQLEFDREAGLFRPYAKLYRFGELTVPGPLVVYVGGSISQRVYEERRDTEPVELVREFARAREQVGPARVDVIFCPCPVNTEGLGDEWILVHFDELASRLGAKPTSLGCAGYSAGAGYATLLALTEEARALAVFGAAGLDRTLASQRDLLDAWVREGRAPFEVDFFLNDHDDVVRNPSWKARLPRSLRVISRTAPGGHEFRDYQANGLVFEAFCAVLRRLAS